MVLSALRTLVDDKRRDVTSNFVTNAQINRYFNEALRRINGLNDWEWTQTSATVSYTDGTYKYSAASDFKAPISLFYTYTEPFTFVSPEDFLILSSQSNNVYAYKPGLTNQLWVKTAFGTGTLSCYYYSSSMAQTSGGSITAELTNDTDSPLLPEYYQDLLVHYALSIIYQKEGLTDDYQIEMGNWERLINDMKREFPSKRQYGLHRMRHINEFAVGGIYDRRENILG